MLSLVLFLVFFLPSSLGDTITDMKHIVIFMQENRAFDHYYGTLKGVRGFNDRAAVQLPSGKPVWFQNVNSSYAELPWHMDTTTTSGTCADAPAMNYPVDIAMWHNGLFDRWNSARDPALGMSYFVRNDLNFYYSLADAFTIGDQYHQSTFTQTNPNRLHLFSGSNGLSAGYPPVLDNTEPKPGFKWETYAETLEKAGISWKVYQEIDNFDDNAFEWFATFQNAKAGSPLYDKGKATVPDLVKAFENDVSTGTLPQVSWIVAPTALSEHADNRPAYGEDLTARLLAVLGRHPDVYKNTMFILNYDEQGGFFDHVPPPTPPTSPTDGKSTVSTQGEVTSQGLPIGLGFRVPLILISPWTTGGYVVSQVFDHTSVIRLIEKRFGVQCPNISPWRRAVCGDLLSAINFNTPNYSWPQLPDTSDYVKKAKTECDTLPPPRVPHTFTMPVQEKGTKPSRALPYKFRIDGKFVASSFNMQFINDGKSGAVFLVYDLNTPTNSPRKYTVGSGQQTSDSLPVVSKYALSVHGPNGFVRQFAGSENSGNVQVSMRYYLQPVVSVSLFLNNTGRQECNFVVVANAYISDGPWKIKVSGGDFVQTNFTVQDSGNWYDFSVTTDVDPLFMQRFMGRVENGIDSITDPAMA